MKIRKTDSDFSKYIRAKNNWVCQRCLKQYPEKAQGLHASHFWGRANESVRFDEDNVTAHCHGCHSYLTANPEEHRAWKLKQLGEQRYNALMVRKNQYKKRDDKMQAIINKELLKSLE